MTTTRWLGTLALLLGTASATVNACGSRANDAGPGDASYRVRGEVVGQSGSGEDARVSIHHEAIPAFKDRDGKPGVMHAMTMAFGLAPEIDAARLSAGSRWSVTFDVRWSREPVLLITRLEPLAPGTALRLDAH